MDCHFARCIWLATPIDHLPRDQGSSSIIDWFAEMADSFPPNLFDNFMIICWDIWGARNTNLWEGKCDSSDVVVSKAITWWHKFIHINYFVLKAKNSPVNPIKWIRLSSGHLKINFDRAWCKDSHVGGLDVVVKDNIGIFMVTSCMNFQDIFSPLQAEPMVVRAYSSWADSRGFRNFLLE